MFDCSPEEVQKLVKLQKYISDMMELETFFKSAVKKLTEIDKKMVKADSLLKTVGAELDKMRRDYKDNETELKRVEEGILKSNQKLTGVKNDKEYQSIQKEITDLNVLAHDISDTGLKILDKLETAEKQFGAKEKDIEAFLQNGAKQRLGLEKKALLAKKKLQQLNDDAGKLKTQLDNNLLAILEDNVRHNLNRQGIVKVEDAICSGCNVNIPRQVYNELLKSNGMELCPACRRLIYYEPPAD